MENKSITVLGSANYDYFLKINRPPAIGETISSNGTSECLGGKGCNTAIAVSKLNNSTNFVGQIGNDPQGKEILQSLNKNKVNSSLVKVLENNETGKAYIFSYPNGDNSIIIVGGANTSWDKNDLQFIYDSIDKSSLLLLQREIPDEINLLASKYAKEKGLQILLDYGGQDKDLIEDLLKYITILSPNETELQRILASMKMDITINLSNYEDVKAVCDKIREKSNNKELSFLFKLGSEGSMFIDAQNNITKQKAFNIKELPIVDTTGAGDCFTGAFGSKYVDMLNKQELNIESCLKYATGAAYLSITKFGASSSAPTLEELQLFLGKY